MCSELIINEHFKNLLRTSGIVLDLNYVDQSGFSFHYENVRSPLFGFGSRLNRSSSKYKLESCEIFYLQGVVHLTIKYLSLVSDENSLKSYLTPTIDNQ